MRRTVTSHPHNSQRSRDNKARKVGKSCFELTRWYYSGVNTISVAVTFETGSISLERFSPVPRYMDTATTRSVAVDTDTLTFQIAQGRWTVHPAIICSLCITKVRHAFDANHTKKIHPSSRHAFEQRNTKSIGYMYSLKELRKSSAAWLIL